MSANISYETLLRLRDRLAVRLAQVDRKIIECFQEHANAPNAPLKAYEPTLAQQGRSHGVKSPYAQP